MANENCPLCAGPMEARSAAPCEQCGGDPESLARYRGRDETYHLVKVLGGREIVLCIGCMLSFGSLDPLYLGVPPRSQYGFESMEVLREMRDPPVRADYFCPACGYRLKFLRFVKDVRSRAGQGTDPSAP
ncbi:MAG TPA: hypothetical protein VHJ78_09370 [Actinomycetota bacterium]|nr:hypothetical protein [Actinomycetota bacterium]